MKPNRALEELRRRERIGESLTEWCRHVGYQPARHHQLIISKLEACTRGEISRCMLFLPPGAGKSVYSSVLFPPWLMAKNGGSILAVSHTVERSEDWGRRIRRIVLEHGGSLPGAQLSDDSAAAGRWSMKNGAEYFAAGVGTAIVGFRVTAGGGVIIDDPVRGAEDAASQGARDKLYSFYRNDVTTRLAPGAFVCLIVTRWNTDDLAGRLLQEEGDQWEVVSLPAQCDSPSDSLQRSIGEWLWDSDPNYRYGDVLRRQKAVMPPKDWAALYQQSPIAEGGNLIKRDWIRNAAFAPDLKTCHTYIGFDLATSEGKGDWSAAVTLAVDANSDYHILDVWRARTTIDKTIDALLDRCATYNPLFLCSESGLLANASGPFLKSRMIERGIYKHLEMIPARHSKELRAQSFIGRRTTQSHHRAGSAADSGEHRQVAGDAEMAADWLSVASPI
jgi:hypothetical protein